MRRTRTATRRSGDKYQDLVAAEALLRVLKHPSRYTWVKFEVREAGKLDDVLVLRTDGTVEATQVKFSTDALRPGDPWTWQRLLETSGGRPSLIQDWCKSIDQLKEQYREIEPRLVSNRSAGEGFYILSNGQVDVESTEADILQELESQLGASTTDFLERFRFNIDEQDLPELDERLERQFGELCVSHLGYLSLKERIERWVRCEQLPPHGEIRLNDIRSACLWNELTSLPQNLEIPIDYTLPPHFHPDFLSRIENGNGGAVVLTAGPGVGKSTYLSHLVQELEDAGQPVIRHHYALEVFGLDHARLEARRIAESLMADISANLGRFLGDLSLQNSGPDDLRSWIHELGSRLQEEGKVLVVVVDGLDHVWRADNSRDELNKLFDLLTPIPEGIVLVVGTQPVADSQLPISLLRLASRNNWVELPGLDERAIYDWLAHQSIMMPPDWNLSNRNWYRLQLAATLFEKTKGHPLLLRFVLERIALSGEYLTIDAIEAISEVPADTVEEYYHALWISLPAEARDVAFLLSIAKFPWPDGSLIDCLQLAGYERSSAVKGLASIQHLMGRDTIGVRVFHRSLTFYAVQRPEFPDRESALRNAIIEWLTTRAPKYWRRAHLWLLQLEDGAAEPLMSGSDREWAVQSIAEGHPPTEVAHILEAAAWQAIEADNFPIYVDRGILSDVVSATDYQEEALRAIFVAQLLLQTDEYLVRRSIAEITELVDTHVLELGIYLQKQGIADEAAACLAEMNRRITRRIDDSDVASNRRMRYGIAAQLAGAVGSNTSNFARFLGSLSSDNIRLEMAESWATGLKSSHDVRSAVRLLQEPLSHRVGDRISRYVAVQAAYEGMQLSTKDQRQLVSLYGAVYQMLYAQDSDAPEPEEPSPPEDARSLAYEEYSGSIGRYVHDLFFFLVVSELQSPGTVECWEPDERLSLWFSSSLASLAQGAKDVADAWRSDQRLPVTAAYDATKELERPSWGRNYDDRQRAVGFEVALRSIIGDLIVFRGASSGDFMLSWEEVETIAAHRFSNFRDILKWIATDGIEVSPSTIESLCSKLEEEMSEWIEPYTERAELLALMATVCAKHDMHGKGRSYLHQSADNLLGYGYHKDLLLHTTLKTLEALAEDSGINQHLWLRLAPPIAAIGEFTDGDETSHLSANLGELLARFETGLAVEYVKFLMDGERYSDVDDILRELARIGDLSDPIIRALVATCVDPDSIRTIEERADEQDSNASVILGLAPRYSSIFAQSETVSSWSGDPFPEEQDILVESFGQNWHRVFPPDRLGELVTHEALVSPRQRAERLSYWLSEWSETERAGEALDVVEPLFLNESRLEVSNEMVTVVRRISGRSRSYPWLVQAQRSNNGWRDYWSSFEHAKERWRALKRDFPNRRQHFLVESIRPQRGFPPWFSGTITRMVVFLIYFGCHEEARAICTQLVDTVCDILSGQDIPMPDWTEQGTSNQ